MAIEKKQRKFLRKVLGPKKVIANELLLTPEMELQVHKVQEDFKLQWENGDWHFMDISKDEARKNSKQDSHLQTEEKNKWFGSKKFVKS